MSVVMFWIVVGTAVVLLVGGAFAYDRYRRNSRAVAHDGQPGNAHSDDIVVQQEHAHGVERMRDW